MEIARIIINVDTGKAGPNQYKNLGHRNAVRKQHHLMGKKAWVEAGRPMVEGKVKVSVVIRRPRPLDPDNAWSSLKWLIDSVFKDGVTKDDSCEFIQLGTIEQICGPEYKSSPSVEFIVEALNQLSEAA